MSRLNEKINLCLLFTGLLFLTSCASQAPLHTYHAISIAPVKTKITEAQEKTASAQSHVKQAQAATSRLSTATTEPCKTKEWQEAYDSLNQELSAAYLDQSMISAALTEAQTRADTNQKEADAQADKANESEKGRVAAVDREKLTAFKYHRVKGLLAACAAAVVLGALLMFGKLAALIPPPYNLILFIGGPAGAAAAVFLLL